MAAQVPRGASAGASRENVLKSFAKRQKDDVKSMLDNFSEIIKLAKVDDDRSAVFKMQTVEQDQLEMSVRAANLVRCAESLMRTNEELKKYFFLNDFPFISQSVQKAREAATADTKNTQSRIMSVYREMQAELHDLEEEYGSVWYIRGDSLNSGNGFK